MTNSVSRPLDSGRRDSLNRRVMVSAGGAAGRAVAPPPPSGVEFDDAEVAFFRRSGLHVDAAAEYAQAGIRQMDAIVEWARADVEPGRAARLVEAGMPGPDAGSHSWNWGVAAPIRALSDLKPTGAPVSGGFSSVPSRSWAGRPVTVAAGIRRAGPGEVGGLRLSGEDNEMGRAVMGRVAAAIEASGFEVPDDSWVVRVDCGSIGSNGRDAFGRGDAAMAVAVLEASGQIGRRHDSAVEVRGELAADGRVVDVGG